MIYSSWIAARRAVVFPEGEAENLVANHNRYIQDALIDVQAKVKHLQTFHRDNHIAESTFFDCGASVFDAPIGFIKSVHTILDTDCCDRAFYSPITEAQMRCRLETQQSCGPRYRAYGFYEYSSGLYAPYSYYYECAITPDAGLDKPCRSRSGSAAIINGQIYLHPHLDSNEIAVVEWDGIKKSWENADDVDFGAFERQVQNLVELHLERQSATKEDHDYDAAATAKNEYDLQVAMLIYETTKLNRIARSPYCFTNCSSC